jgi:hypothetical protein
MSFWESLWLVLVTSWFVAYLWVMFSTVLELVRDGNVRVGQSDRGAAKTEGTRARHPVCIASRHRGNRPGHRRAESSTTGRRTLEVGDG